MNKKGIIDQLNTVVIALIGVALVLVVGFLVIAEVQDQAATIDGCVNSSATWNGSQCTGGGEQNQTTVTMNATFTTQDALADIPGWLPIIVITIIGALLIGLVALFRRE